MDDRLRKLKGKVHVIACDARMLSRVVDSEAFARAWDVACDVRRRELEGYIASVDKGNVDLWIRRVLSGPDLETKSFRELRDIAKLAGVAYYNNKSKEELIKELRT